MAKKSETVRERSQTTGKAKSRRVRNTATTVTKPIAAGGRGVKKGLKPFSFLLAPFKTRPMRFIGRILAKVLLINYLRSSWRELRQVTWPNRRNTVKLTTAVFIFAIVFGAIIATVDYGLDKIFHKLLLG